MKKLIIAGIFSLVYTFGGLNAVAQQAVNIQKLDSLFNSLEAHNKMMGRVIIAKDGKPVYTKSIGAYKIEGDKELKANAQTVYKIGSISEIFTSVMIFQLIDEKKLTLETTLSKYFPKVPIAEYITIEQMLNHYSGIRDITDLPKYANPMTKPKTKDEMLSLIYATQSELTPNSQAQYSNTNYILLGYIIEEITGMPYKEALEKRITDKISMKHTFYGGNINKTTSEASSYMSLSGKWVERPETDISILGGAGGIVSTTEDLDKFITALFNKELISEASLNTMTTIEGNFGRGVTRFPLNGRYAIGHTGSIDGFASQVAYFPDDHVSIAITMNASNYSLNNIASGMLKILYNMPYSIPSFTVNVDPAMLVKYAGIYGSKQIPLKFTLKNENGQLMVQATGQDAFVLEAVSNSEFKSDVAGIKVTFSKKEGSDQYDFTLLQGSGSYLFEKE